MELIFKGDIVKFKKLSGTETFETTGIVTKVITEESKTSYEIINIFSINHNVGKSYMIDKCVVAKTDIIEKTENNDIQKMYQELNEIKNLLIDYAQIVNSKFLQQIAKNKKETLYDA